MPIPANRIIRPPLVRNFGRFGDAVEVPNLTDVQTRSYDRFLQLDVPLESRENIGLESVLREIFPIESYDNTIAAPNTSATSSASRVMIRPSAASSASPTVGRSASGCALEASSRSRKRSIWATCRS